MFNKFTSWWMGGNLPKEHQRIITNDDTSPITKVRLYIRKWIIHPIKRRIAKNYLSILKMKGLKVVAITGSAGKTSTKEMLASILKLEGNTVYSYANIDPIYNIPTTILKCKPSTKYLILEMGVEYKGEMDFYLWLAKPDIGIITNIYKTHTLYFKNEEGVYKEKSKLAKGVDKNGVVILNYENEYLKRLGEKLKVKTIWYGKGSNNFYSDYRFDDQNKGRFVLNIDKSTFQLTSNIFGEQFVLNTLAATLAAKYLGVTDKVIKRGISNFRNEDHRMKFIKHKSGALIIDDSYNNNPSAAQNAIDAFSKYIKAKNKIFVFGDMLELGHLEKVEHRKIGDIVNDTKINVLICVGRSSIITAQRLRKLAKHKKVYYFKNIEESIDIIRKYLKSDTAIMIKGSRSIGLDKLVISLMQ